MKKLTSLLLALVIAVGIIAPVASWAWFTAHLEWRDDFTGSSMVSYFGGGDGTEGNPFVINRPTHLYNLAWLQDKGVFNERLYYFSLESDLDMRVIGAIPPIGTDINPFTGVFDGNEHVINHLWTSSVPSDWTYRPATTTILDTYVASSATTVEDSIESVGMFGKILKTDEDVTCGLAKHFYLVNNKVTTNKAYSDKDGDGATTVNDTGYSGILAGIMDGSLVGIGVKNSSIEFRGSLAVKSDYSIIGFKTGEVEWVDQPGLGGHGDLKILPNIYKSGYAGIQAEYRQYFVQMFDTDGDGVVSTAEQVGSPMPSGSVGSGSSIDCIGASTDASGNVNAKFYGAISIHEAKPGASAAYKYTATVADAMTFGSTYYAGPNTSTMLNEATEKAKTDEEILVDREFWSAYDAQKVALKMATSGKKGTAAYPSFSGKTPQNVIWFKPQSTGTATIAFLTDNMSSDGYMALYRFTRDASGNIQNVEEMTFCFSKNNATAGQLGNGNAVYFEVKVDKNHEYAIGRSNAMKSSDVDNVSFLYLKLGGADKSGGSFDDAKRLVLKVDFMENVPVQAPETDAWAREESAGTVNYTHTNHDAYFRLDGNVTSGGTVYYNALSADKKVHYTATAGITVAPFGAAKAEDANMATYAEYPYAGSP